MLFNKLMLDAGWSEADLCALGANPDSSGMLDKNKLSS
jgi:hypothetical protein